jgi:L-fuculose-phosphate aldolase
VSRARYPARAAAAREIALVCRRLCERGLIAGPDGNVSVRLGPDRVLVTPAGISKVDVTPRDLVEVALDGTPRGRAPAGRRASTEVGMHLRIYARRPDAMAVVHAHPPTATAFAVAGEGLPDRVLPELIFLLGAVPLVPYATPGTPALADGLEPFLGEHDAFLLANHGATTLGPTLRVAHQRMESLEHGARILMAARQLGRVNQLADEHVRFLVDARRRLTGGDGSPGTGPTGRRRTTE